MAMWYCPRAQSGRAARRDSGIGSNRAAADLCSPSPSVRAQEMLLIVPLHQRSGVFSGSPVDLEGIVRPMSALFDELLDMGEVPEALTHMARKADRSPFFREGCVRLVNSGKQR